MSLTEERRKGRKEMSLMIREKGRARRELKAKTITFYREYITAGVSDEEAREKVLERLESLGLTERKLKKYIENPADVSNPKAMAMSDAKIAVWLEKTMGDIDEVRDECDEQLDQIEHLDAGDWVEVEETTDTSDKGGGIKTKKRPVSEVRLALMERKLKSLDSFYSALKNLRGNSPLLNVNIRGDIDSLSAEDIANKIRELEIKHRIHEPISAEED